MGWASEEFETIDLGDKRLNKRAALLAERLVDSPSASIPKACQGWKETQAAYRLISNDAVNAELIAEPHIACTERRMAAQHEVRPEHILESDRWIEGYERVAETAAGLPDTRCVCVADREADIVSLMYRAAELEHPADWLIRSKHNRTSPEGGKLWASVTAEKPIGEIRFILAARRGVKSRPVHQQLFVKRLSIPNGKKDDDKGTLKVSCLVAREINPPKGAKPVQWRLLTNRQVNEKQPPKKVPTVNEVVRLIARLGGFLRRKGDGEPGVKTIWQGMEQVASFTAVPPPPGIAFLRFRYASTGVWATALF